MEREMREVGEGSSSSLREQRNLREKQRRVRMKDLYLELSSHVSPTHRLPGTSYMIQLREKVDNLTEKRKTLLGQQVQNRSEESSFIPQLNIRSRDSTIEMNLIMHQNMKRVKLHELVSVFEEEGAQVMSVNNLHNLNDRITYTIIAQANICWIGIDPSRIEERVKDIISR